MLNSGKKTSATALGGLAILLWSTTFACNRSLSEQVGPITAAAAFQTLGGLIGILLLSLRGKGLRHLFRLPRAYLGGCGSLFVISQTCAFLSVGWAVNRQQAIATSLVYYLWPGLTLVFSIPIHRQRARIILLPGIMIAFAGVAMVTLPSGQLDIAGWGKVLSGNYLAYVFAAMGAITWALYSNFSRRYAAKIEAGAVPLFLLASGVFLGILRLGIPEPTVFTMRAGLEILFMGLFPMLMAYSLWDISVRRGNLNIVATMSYMAPFLSALASCLYLGISPPWTLWCGCALIVSGAVLSKLSIHNAKPVYSQAELEKPGCDLRVVEEQ